jgi:hypothetical protein
MWKSAAQHGGQAEPEPSSPVFRQLERNSGLKNPVFQAAATIDIAALCGALSHFAPNH